ncbi:DNA alkylation repair protein [Fundicoccus culcitae]|uniref:DNA alkylation repair protein n=1 Tax=Fundicoccus culcitae TaxID=2969821 RepID=A0ABY5P9A8_9LACT|nr:DNA alkylation repair protein [Fundicoccus culcitae]UUX34950.1 DNA alkylation repair protein [Fundicoccus culcitae]
MKTTKENISAKAEGLLAKLGPNTLRGELRKLAKEIKLDHELAMELWSSGELNARMLAILIMDKKQLDAKEVDRLITDMSEHPYDERISLMDWLYANQLSKNKKLLTLIDSWEHSDLALQRRTYWYYQARQRWTGQTPPDNTAELLDKIEAGMADEVPEVQFTMNLTAGWIGIYDEQYRERCIDLGERLGLYKGEMVSKGCTPSYLPEFIAIEVGKRS